MLSSLEERRKDRPMTLRPLPSNGLIVAGNPGHGALHATLRDEYGIYLSEADSLAHGWGIAPHERPEVARRARIHATLHEDPQPHAPWDFREIGFKHAVRAA
jgi:hypothetical protein